MFKTRHLMIAMGAVSLPIAYLIKQHVDWMQSPEGKGRVLTQMLTFFLSCVPSVYVFHKAFALKKTLPHRTLKQAGMALAASLMPVLGFQGGIQLAAIFYPHKTKRPKNRVPFLDVLSPVPVVPTYAPPVFSAPLVPRVPRLPNYPVSAYPILPSGFGRVSGI